MDIQLFDSTLRDGTQSEGLSLSVEDKLKIARLLDGFGIHYIEGGYPGSNPKDVEFFERAKSIRFQHAKLTAFGMTRKAGGRADTDPILRAMVAAETPAVAVVGKTWTMHVTKIVGTTLEENLAMISDSVAYLKQQGREVVFDCEHFFDGFRADRDYTLAAVRAASTAGADWIAMCDTNGGTLPGMLAEIVGEVRRSVTTPLGIHTHNDSDVAVANAFAGVDAGCTQVQGTINGWGERCGNANLISVIAGLQLKMGKRCVPDESLARLTELSRAVSEIANIRPRAHAPYVGQSAFAHKGGMHVAAVEKIPASYEHIVPERVGNRRHIVVSELSGRGNVRMRATELGIDVKGNERSVLGHVKDLESQGYQFEAAEGSFELLGRRSHPDYVAPFEVVDIVVISERRRGSSMFAEATIKLDIGGEVEHVVAEGTGPVHALDGAFHKALDRHFPELRDVHLADYKVRILDPDAATGAKTRVLIETAKGEERWSTIGVSQNIIEASAIALADALELPLSRLAAASQSHELQQAKSAPKAAQTGPKSPLSLLP